MDTDLLNQELMLFKNFQGVKQLRRFFGLVGYYRKSKKKIAAILDPLYKLLSPHKNSVKPVEWTSLTLASFLQIKQVLSNATLLNYPIPEAQTELITDASNTAIGATIQQVIDGVV